MTTRQLLYSGPCIISSVMNLIDSERSRNSFARSVLGTSSNIFSFKAAQQLSQHQSGGGGGGMQQSFQTASGGTIGASGGGGNGGIGSSSIDLDSTEGFTNFAPFASIACTNPIGNPVDILVQNSNNPTGGGGSSLAATSHHHRRIRSTIWSYHFQPDETKIGLLLTFPHAFLLKEIQIVPNTVSINNIPAYVSVEVSRDGSPQLMTPVGAPLFTMGLPAIRLQLTKSELVSAVRINLYKAKDSLAIGLSQVRLLGYPMFENMLSAKPDMMLTPVEDLVARSNMGWLRLLHMCLPAEEAWRQCGEDEATTSVISRISKDTILLCTRLLASPAMIIYDKLIEQILVRIARHSRGKALTIVGYLLRAEHGSGQGMFSVSHGVLMETLVSILYQICDELGRGEEAAVANKELVVSVLSWLREECFARRHVPSHMLLHCVATIFYHQKNASEMTDDATSKKFFFFLIYCRSLFKLMHESRFFNYLSIQFFKR